MNLLNLLRKGDKKLDKPCILSFYPNLFNELNKIVKPVLNGHSQKDRKLVFKANYHLMQVKRIAECSNGEHSAILTIFVKLRILSLFLNMFNKFNNECSCKILYFFSPNQLEEAKKPEDYNKEEEKTDQPDIKSEDNAIEMSDDLEGKLHDLEKCEDDEEDEKEGEDEEELDRQMGEVDEKETEKLDEQMWGSDDEEEGSDSEVRVELCVDPFTP